MKNILLILLLATVISGCSKDTGSNEVDNVLVNFEIIPNVAEVSAHAELTRAKVDGVFTPGTRIGLSISSSTPMANIHQMYKNFYAQNDGTTWGYYLNGSYNGTMMSGYQSWGDITVMGYYPYDPVATDVSAIPFTIATMTGTDTAVTDEETATVDYMVAESKAKNMAADPSSGEVSLEFNHLMTSISFWVNRSYQGPQIKLSKVKFEIDGNRTFGVGGTYNAKNPVMSDMGSNLTITEEAKTLTVNYTSSEKTITYNTTLRETPLLIMPPLKQTGGVGGADDATVTLTFYFTDAFGIDYKFDDSGTPATSYTDGNGNPMLSFKLSGIDNSPISTNKGLLAGFNYRIQANIGTYVRFDGAPVLVEKNLDNQTKSEHIEI